MQKIAKIDQYGKTDILNIYYDTPNYELIQTSLESPNYKEKLRLRTYGVPTDESTAFLEIKKKYKGIVYKRREAAKYIDALAFLNCDEPMHTENQQIHKEIRYFKTIHEDLEPKMMISYKRTAWEGTEDDDLRITFDEDIEWREDRLDLRLGKKGRKVFEKGNVLMEIKVKNAIPLNFARLLTRECIYPTKFSKYGTAFTQKRKEEQMQKAICF